MRYLIVFRSTGAPSRPRFAASAHRAGVLLARDELEPSGARIVVRHGQRIDDPASSAEPTGIAFIDVKSLAEAVEWANRLADDFEEIALMVYPIAAPAPNSTCGTG